MNYQEIKNYTNGWKKVRSGIHTMFQRQNTYDRQILLIMSTFETIGQKIDC